MADSALFSSLINFGNKIVSFLEKFVAPLLLLAMRLWIARIFFKSGLVKVSNMQSAIFLFKHEYHVPIIPPIVAAYSAASFEIICPIFLVLGLLTRLAAFPLIAMTLVIQFLVIHNQEHFYWLFLLSTILIYGAGKISADNFVKLRSA